MTGPETTAAHSDRKDVPADRDEGWFNALKIAYSEANRDNAGIIAAGVAYYAFLAIVPLLAAMVMGYGLFADPETVAQNARTLAGTLPQDAADLINGQLEAAAEAATGAKGLGLVLALGIALLGARGGATALIQALNIAYDIEDQRSFLRKNLMALGMTVGAAIGAIMVVLSITATALLGGLGGKVASLLVTFGFAVLGAALIYRFAPHRSPPPLRHQLPGAIFFAIAIVVLTAGFGFYVANFGSYNATYGSLGAVVVLLTWLYLSAYALLFGAELNAPSEHTETRRN